MTKQDQKMTTEDILQLGRAYMQDAQQREEESDCIAAGGIYRMCCELFLQLSQTDSPAAKEAKGEYMHALFRSAMLPQVDSQEKIRYLNEAHELAAQLRQETGEMEYMIALDCIQEEMEELNKSMELQVDQKQQCVLSF